MAHFFPFSERERTMYIFHCDKRNIYIIKEYVKLYEYLRIDVKRITFVHTNNDLSSH